MKKLNNKLSAFARDRLWPLIKTRLPLVILGTALLITVVMILARPRDVPAPRAERAWIVDVQRVDYRTINPTLELFGSVQSPQDADLSAGIEATVNDVPVRDGETVLEGQLLVVLDDRDATLTLRQRQADIHEIEAQSSFADRQIEINRIALEQEKDLLGIAQTRFDRAKELLDLGRLSRSDFENATENLKRAQLSLNRSDLALEESRIRLNERQAQLERAQALHDQAALDVARTRVLAPFDGIVSGIQVSEGDRVRVGDSLMRLQNPSTVEVRTQVPADYVQSINQGLRTEDAITAVVQIDDGTVMGRITRVSGLIREGSGGVDSFIGFYAPPIGLRLGSTVRVLLQLPAETGVIAVPAEAVYGLNRIYKVSNDRMMKVDVQRVGERALEDGSTEVIIRSPELTNSDTIIVTKIANAADGLLVKIAEKEPASAQIPTASNTRRGG
ncbi:MAG: efflux RND transporter periplasmic adaptor subunit [Rhodospirillaceae bacterium]|nr:efflux RND transporter periplasmic adaptor subunit [Rhodospirillaceae bacterium]